MWPVTDGSELWTLGTQRKEVTLESQCVRSPHDAARRPLQATEETILSTLSTFTLAVASFGVFENY